MTHQVRNSTLETCPYEVGEAELQDLFAAAGTVETVNAMRDVAPGRARGFGFVQMSTEDEAPEATAQFTEHSMGGGGYGGGRRPAC